MANHVCHLSRDLYKVQQKPPFFPAQANFLNPHHHTATLYNPEDCFIMANNQTTKPRAPSMEASGQRSVAESLEWDTHEAAGDTASKDSSVHANPAMNLAATSQARTVGDSNKKSLFQGSPSGLSSPSGPGKRRDNEIPDPPSGISHVRYCQPGGATSPASIAGGSNKSSLFGKKDSASSSGPSIRMSNPPTTQRFLGLCVPRDWTAGGSRNLGLSGKKDSASTFGPGERRET